MLTDALLFLPLCALAAVVYQTTRSDDLGALLQRSARTFILWALGMCAISLVVLALSIVL